MTSRILGQFCIWPLTPYLYFWEIDTLFLIMSFWLFGFGRVDFALFSELAGMKNLKRYFLAKKRQKETIVRSTHVLPVMNCPCWPRNNHQTCSIFAPIDESVVVVSATPITKQKPLKKSCLHKTTSDQTTSRSTEYKIMTLDHFSAFLFLWICFWKNLLISSRGINVVISSINVLASSILQVACIEEKPQTV